MAASRRTHGKEGRSRGFCVWRSSCTQVQWSRDDGEATTCNCARAEQDLLYVPVVWWEEARIWTVSQRLSEAGDRGRQRRYQGQVEMTPKEIAAWMLAELERDGSLEQSSAVYEIEKRFGEEFTWINDSGGQAIRRDVLTAFRKL